MPTFAKRLAELRKGAGLSQAALARAAGVPVGNIRNWEQGQREPSWAAVFRLAAGLGADCRAFADCDGAVPTRTPRKKKK
jgi:transcriptional regulator with XRE-family HTH domain